MPILKGARGLMDQLFHRNRSISDYTPLRREYREIRLASLKPGDPEDDIQLSLSAISLDDGPKYVALSYVWGDLDDTYQINLNGQAFQVTRNLRDALIRLRQPKQGKAQTIWVDAICIDQANVLERNSQVLLMGSIYQQCTRCVVWLGEEDSATEDALEFIKWMASDKHILEWPCFQKIPNATLNIYLPDGLGELFEDEDDLESPLALKLFMERPWWFRTWTVQEIVLPKKVQILCGKYEIGWEEIVRASSAVTKHWKTCCTAHYCGLGQFQGSIFASFADYVDTIQTLRNTFKEHQESDLIRLLADFRSRLASCSHDKVYAFLGLTSQRVRAGIVPNYDLEVGAVFAQPVIGDMQMSLSYQALGHVLENQPSMLLPSWVPDWSSAPRDWANQRWRLARYWLFNASADIARTGEVHENKVIREPGIKYDEIIQVGDLVTGPTSNRLALLGLEAWGQLIQLKENPERKYSETDTIMTAFCKTMLMDSYIFGGRGMRANENVLKCWDQWWQIMCRNSEFMPDPNDEGASFFNSISYTVISSILWRRFFVTKSGAFGLGPSDTQVTDEVFIIQGGRQPLVLRKSTTTFAPPGADKAQICHALVGDCYVHGIMDGEAAQGLKADPKDVFIV
ncbi:hypothetical protein ACMFMG_004468 [Clarireedia jacksonii]